MSGVAMSAAITGLANFQKMLDVVADNLSNSATTGFKSSSVNFQELMYQTLTPASSPNPAVGGTNALQLGLGSNLASIDTNLSQGNIQVTGSTTDLAMTGQGYFVLATGPGSINQYTRDGHFAVDVEGNLVDSGGRQVQGWMGVQGVVNTKTPLESLSIPNSEVMTASATTKANFAGNLNAAAANATTYVTQVTVYDAMGEDYHVDVTFTKNDPPTGAGAAEWGWSADMGATNLGTGTLAFDSKGYYDAANSSPTPMNFTLTPTNGADPVSVTPDFSAITQLANSAGSAVLPSGQDGFPSGTLTSFTIGRDGMIVGQYSNSMTRNVGQVAVAHFANAYGLEKGQGNLLKQSVNSGEPALGVAGTGPRGQITAGALEASNVDISTEFTKLIQAQRAFEANSKVITTMDSILNTTNQLKQ